MEPILFGTSIAPLPLGGEVAVSAAGEGEEFVVY